LQSIQNARFIGDHLSAIITPLSIGIRIPEYRPLRMKCQRRLAASQGASGSGELAAIFPYSFIVPRGVKGEAANRRGFSEMQPPAFGDEAGASTAIISP
jgi:hypothetical protein